MCFGCCTPQPAVSRELVPVDPVTQALHRRARSSLPKQTFFRAMPDRGPLGYRTRALCCGLCPRPLKPDRTCAGEAQAGMQSASDAWPQHRRRREGIPRFVLRLLPHTPRPLGSAFHPLWCCGCAAALHTPITAAAHMKLFANQRDVIEKLWAGDISRHKWVRAEEVTW